MFLSRIGSQQKNSHTMSQPDNGELRRRNVAASSSSPTVVGKSSTASKPAKANGGASSSVTAAAGGSAASMTKQVDAAAELKLLQRTRASLHEQLSQVETSLDGIVSGDRVLDELAKDMSGMEGEVSRGRQLLRRIGVQGSRDDALVAAAWVLFSLVVMYVWARRVLGLFPVEH